MHSTTILARRAALALAALTLAAASLLAVRPAASQAGASCTKGPVRSHDGRTYHTKTCPNYAGKGVYQLSNGVGPVLDHMRSTSSWFACQQRFADAPNPKLGSGRNHYWLWTEGDDHHTWGWFPANAIKIGGQEAAIPGVPMC